MRPTKCITILPYADFSSSLESIYGYLFRCGCRPQTLWPFDAHWTTISLVSHWNLVSVESSCEPWCLSFDSRYDVSRLRINSSSVAATTIWPQPLWHHATHTDFSSSHIPRASILIQARVFILYSYYVLHSHDRDEIRERDENWMARKLLSMDVCVWVWMCGVVDLNTFMYQKHTDAGILGIFRGISVCVYGDVSSTCRIWLIDNNNNTYIVLHMPSMDEKRYSNQPIDPCEWKRKQRNILYITIYHLISFFFFFLFRHFPTSIENFMIFALRHCIHWIYWRTSHQIEMM